MLVLTRKNNEEILLGNNIRMRVLSIRGNTVRIGIEAPKSVNIQRGELVKTRNILPISDSQEWPCVDDAAIPADR